MGTSPSTRLRTGLRTVGMTNEPHRRWGRFHPKDIDSSSVVMSPSFLKLLLPYLFIFGNLSKSRFTSISAQRFMIVGPKTRGAKIKRSCLHGWPRLLFIFGNLSKSRFKNFSVQRFMIVGLITRRSKIKRSFLHGWPRLTPFAWLTPFWIAVKWCTGIVGMAMSALMAWIPVKSLLSQRWID